MKSSLGVAAIAGLALCSSEGQTSSRLVRRSGGHADVPGERQGRDPRSDFSERFEFGADSEARADAHSLVPVPPSRRAPFDVVALASSAGGLSALGTVLSALPHDFPGPIVVVQHLDARHRSLMAE